MHKSRALVAVAALAATAGLAVPSANAATATLYVSPKGTDTGTCTSKQTPCKTISYAVTQATAGATVDVAAGHYAESVDVGIPLTIVGAGASKTVITGNGTDPGLELESDQTVISDSLRNLSVVHTKSFGIVADNVHLNLSGVDSDYNGANVFLMSGSLTATHSSFSHGVAVSGSDGLPGIGVVALSANVSLTDSAVGSNAYVGIIAEPGSTAAASNRALVDHKVAVSAPAFAHSTFSARRLSAATPALSIRDSSVSGNNGPGIGVFHVKAKLTDDTIADNKSTALYVENSTVSLSQLTIAGTKKYTGKAQFGQQAGIVSVKAVSDNKVVAAPKQVTIAGSIDAANKVPDCNTHLIDHGWNLSSDKTDSCKFTKKNHDLIKTSPKLGSLGHHGGYAGTVLPLKGSPAINAVPLKHAGCVKGALDQRGVKRPQPTGGRCDIGSVELVQKKK